MLDLNNIGLVIHFRRDVDDRLRNLKTVLSFYKKFALNLEIVIINDDIVPDPSLKSLHDEFNCKILYLKNDGLYHRTLAFNKGVKELKSDYFIAGDTDVVIDPRYILQCKIYLEDNPSLGVIYPYNGLFIHLKQKMFDEFIIDYDTSKLTIHLDKIEKRPLYEDGNFLVAHANSIGGSVLFNKQHFTTINGYNVNFKAWGWEDDEILTRMRKLGFKSHRIADGNAIAWHFPHPNTVKEKHEMYINNQQHNKFVTNCSISELKQYIKTWQM